MTKPSAPRPRASHLLAAEAIAKRMALLLDAISCNRFTKLDKKRAANLVQHYIRHTLDYPLTERQVVKVHALVRGDDSLLRHMALDPPYADTAQPPAQKPGAGARRRR